jgi:hypothetical protein
MAIDAVEDYVKGPAYLIKDQESLNKSILSRYGQYAALPVFAKARLAFGCIARWLGLVIVSRAAWYRAAKQWKEFRERAVTEEFWKTYLGMS